MFRFMNSIVPLVVTVEQAGLAFLAQKNSLQNVSSIST